LRLLSVFFNFLLFFSDAYPDDLARPIDDFYLYDLDLGMHFELTETLMDDILFSMENQGGHFLVDTQEGIVVEAGSELQDRLEQDKEGTRYIDLPRWTSSDGYRLMERFVAVFKNPIVRNELLLALDRGKGVFRAFKDTLNHYPEAEKRWFSFKEQELKQEIVHWYNALRDEWGLARIGTEPEETEELVREDFIFREPHQRDYTAAEELHYRCLEEYRKLKKPILKSGAFFKDLRGFPGELALVAETSSGDFIAYISVEQQDKTLHIAALEVQSEYRGLGIGEELFSRLLDRIDPRAILYITMDLPIEVEGFSRVLLRKSFKPYTTRYYLSREL
jgi:GNAT superfamily N-acetyltransferase